MVEGFRGNATLSRFARAMKRLARDRLFFFGLAVVVFMAIVAVFAPWLTPYASQGNGFAAIPPPTCQGVPTEVSGLCPPSLAHPFGTEELGRDLMVRIFFGVRTSITIGFYVVVVAVLIGLAVGLTAAFFGGWVDEILMRITDIFLSFPHVVLALVVVTIIGPSYIGVFIALGVVWWPAFARLSRGKALVVKNQNFVLAAKAAGMGNGSIIVRHILPNSLAPLVVQMALDMGFAVLAEAGLSFLGLGVRPPTADLGVMIFEARFYLTTAWWFALFPGTFLFLIVLSFNLIGDRVTQYLDPRQSMLR